ncbi:MAG: response regulator [Isosphaeraceae bacterium]
MRIMVVDDSRTALATLRVKLEEMRYQVVPFDSGQAAWDHLQAADERLIITDWMMPQLDGLELCRRIRARGLDPYVYVIMLTSKPLRMDHLAGLEAGADDFLVKPVDTCELAIALARARRFLGAQALLHGRIQELERRAIDPAPVFAT